MNLNNQKKEFQKDFDGAFNYYSTSNVQTL